MIVDFFPILRRVIEGLGEKGTDCAAFKEQFVEINSSSCSVGRRRVVYSSATKGLEVEEGGVRVDFLEKFFQFPF